MNGYAMASEPNLTSTRSSFTQGPPFRRGTQMQLRMMCWLGNLLVIGQEEKIVSNKRRQVCLMMRHDDFDDGQIFHAVARFCKVTEEGPVESLFDILRMNDVENDENVAVGVMRTWSVKSRQP